MKLFILEVSYYGNWEARGVFSTEALAEAAGHEAGADEFIVTECTLDQAV